MNCAGSCCFPQYCCGAFAAALLLSRIVNEKKDVWEGPLMRRFLLACAAAILLLPICLTGASADDPLECTLLWEFVPAMEGVTNGEAFIRITGCENPTPVIFIPAQIGGTPVREIGSQAFYGCTVLEHIIISDSVKFIRQESFRYCSNLSRVDFPALLESIGAYAFADCGSLKEMHLPPLINGTGNGVFSGQTLWCGANTVTARHLSLTRVLFRSPSAPDYVIRLADKRQDYRRGISTYADLSDGLFIDQYLGDAAEVNIPSAIDGVPIELVGGAFHGNDHLTSASIPHGVVSLTGNTFQDCVSLTSVSLPGTLDVLGPSSFQNYTALDSIYIPPSVTVLDVYLFDGCTSLTELHLPDHISSFGYKTFSGQLLWCRADTDTARCLSVSRTSFVLPSAPDYLIRLRDIGGTSSTAELSDALVVTGYIGSGGKTVIPPSINGLPVEIIKPFAFRGC